MNDINATIVFQKNWEAIHATNEDGSRKYRYIINEGSSRSSKTHSLIQIKYLIASRDIAKRLSVWRDTKKDCRDTVGNDMKKIFPTLPHYYNNVTFNKTESIYQFKTGSSIEICGTDEPNRLHGYNCDVAWLNEPYDISRDTFDQLDMRTTDFILIDWNPKKAHWIDEIKKDDRTIVIHSTFKDNPRCPTEQRLKILSYQTVSFSDVVISGLMNEVQAKSYNLIENPLKLSQTQIKELSRCKENERKGSASAFNWSVYGLGLKAERPNRIFTWNEISNDEYNKIDSKIYYASDWGVVDPWGVIEAKYYDGALYLHEKNYASENEIKAILNVTELQQINAMDEGLVKWWFNRLNINKKAVIVCDDNRPGKVMALRQAGYDYAITAIKGQGSVLEGIGVLEKLKVYYTSSSSNLKYEQENYSRQVDRYGIVLEEPEDLNNHLIDPARYIVAFLRAQGIIKII